MHQFHTSFTEIQKPLYSVSVIFTTSCSATCLSSSIANSPCPSGNHLHRMVKYNIYIDKKKLFVSLYSWIWINRFCVTYLLTDKVAWPTWYNLNVYIVTFDLLLPINRTITWSSPSKPTKNGIRIIVCSFWSFKAFLASNQTIF